MRESLHTLDLHHLSVLALLLQNCSVTKAAEQSGQAQSAISRTLRRLRTVLGDPLLVRSGSKLVPTERGVSLRGPLQEILAQIACMEAGASFEPAVAERTFNIACADCLPPSLLPRIIARVSEAGPRINMRMRLIDPAFDPSQELEEGRIDLVINNSPRPREDLHIGQLFTDEVVCMMSADHALASAERLSVAAYLECRHLAPHPSSVRDLGPVDGELARAGHRRNIVATVPEFNLVPYVLTCTDLLFTTGRRFAEHYAALMPLKIVHAPAEFPAMRFYQLWHERNHMSTSNRWLRQQVQDVARSI
jgi:DNA-binding transcriptional LysR family regulator